MKKFKIGLVLILMLMLAALLCSCGDGDGSGEAVRKDYPTKTLNVYNWGEYISDEDDEVWGLIDVNAAFEEYFNEHLADKYGYYVFESLRPGTYVLRLDAKEGDVLTYHFGEPLGEIDSDIDPDTGLSAPIALKSGQTLRNIDVGLTEHAN